MKLFMVLCFIGVIGLVSCQAPKNVVCFYNSFAYLRTGPAKMHLTDLEMPTEFCSHLVYGYAGIKAGTNEVHSLNVDLDMFHYNQVTMLKAKHPQLKVYLSVGGDADVDEAHPNKYIELLESDEKSQQNFIDSAMVLLRRNGFDGLDLAFQLPRNKPRKVHGTLGTYWKKFKKLFTGDFIVDPIAETHQIQYTNFVKRVKRAFASVNLALTMTVLPNVNSTWYFDVPNLHSNFEFINLAAFDFVTPERNPEEADYTAPIYQPIEQNRLPHYNVEFQVNYWLSNHCPGNKLNLGIATYGRKWQMTADSGLSGLPVVQYTDFDYGNSTVKQSSVISWPDICSKLPNKVNANYRGAYAPLRKVTDLEHKYGNYAVRPADEKGEYGMWVSFDDPDFASIKASYAKNKGLGGVAIFDLSYDDFRGLCTGQKYPILRSIKYNL